MQIRRVDKGREEVSQGKKVGKLQDHEVKELKGERLGINVSVQAKATQKHSGSMDVPDAKESQKTDLIGRVLKF